LIAAVSSAIFIVGHTDPWPLPSSDSSFPRSFPRGLPSPPYNQQMAIVSSLTGEFKLPTETYEGTSLPLSINLKLLYDFRSSASGTSATVRTLGKDRKALQLDLDAQSDYTKLQVELQGAGIVIDGERKQSMPLSKSNIAFNWNCFFKDSGNPTATFVFSGLRENGSIDQFARLDYPIKVVQIDHLTHQQVWKIGLITGFLTFLSTSFAVIKSIREVNWPRRNPTPSIVIAQG
jgi:hypothetical protein